MISVRVEIARPDGILRWRSDSPMRVEILTRFGAEDSKAAVHFDRPLSLDEPPHVGEWLIIRMAGQVKFRGRLTELRTSDSPPGYSLHGVYQPARQYPGLVRGLFQEMTPSQILGVILGQLNNGLEPGGVWPSERILDRLDFRGIPLFYAIDLLALLAGNWLWWIDWEDQLHFVPPDKEPDYIWFFDPERDELSPGSDSGDVLNLFRFHGGVRNGREYRRYFEDPGSRQQHGTHEKTLFVRAISTDPVYEYLRTGILTSAPWPGNIRWIGRRNDSVPLQVGESFKLQGTTPVPWDSDGIFRVAAEEIRWNESEYRVRYHLAKGLESASRRTRYLDHEPSGLQAIAAFLGPFRLDLSALDSEVHLDS
jgi:hypothetical protein